MNADDPQRDPFVHFGTVVDVDDPMRRHRVRVALDGATSKSAWAFPRGAGGGPQRGGHVAPKVGDSVLVTYLGGDLNRPLYEAAWWGAVPGESTELPTAITAAGADAALVQAFEAVMGDAAFRVTLDERENRRAWRVEAVRKLAGGGEAVIASLELDLEKNVVDLFGMGGIQLRSLGFIDLKALTARLLKRRVNRDRRPI